MHFEDLGDRIVINAENRRDAFVMFLAVAIVFIVLGTVVSLESESYAEQRAFDLCIGNAPVVQSNYIDTVARCKAESRKSTHN
jgi:hypothetical protein